MNSKLDLPVEAETLIPHRKPMRLVDRLLKCRDGSGTVEAVIEKGSMLLDENGNLEPAAMIELMAQSFAMVKGYEDINNSEPVKNGFLVGVKKADTFGKASAGDRLLVTVKKIWGLEGFVVAEGDIKNGSEVIARGSIKLWVSDEETA